MHNIPHSKEAKKKMSIAHKGKHYSQKTEFKKGMISWSKGIKGIIKFPNRKPPPPFTEEHRKNIGNSHKGEKHHMFGKPMNPALKAQLIKFHTGRKASLETRRKMSENGQKGSKNHFWKGGITPINAKIRHSIEYKDWRQSVFERDNYTCVLCGLKFIKGVTGRVIIHADHIKSFALYPELRFELSNGRTLCVSCHKKTDTFGGKMNKKSSG